MKNFIVYKHPTLGYKAVKQGWSWPAFFFCGIWLAVKGLWSHFAVFLLLAIIVAAIDPNIAATLFGLIAGFVGGSAGNAWFEKKLIAQGFISVGVFRTQSPEAAIAVSQASGR